MTVANELIMLMKGILIPFYPRETKEAYGILFEIDRDINQLGYPDKWHALGAWKTVRKKIEEYLILRRKAFIKKVRVDGITPRKIVHNLTYNHSVLEIEKLSGWDSISILAFKDEMKGYEVLSNYVANKVNNMKTQ